MTTLSLAEAQALAEAALSRAGAAPWQAGPTARALVAAEAAGQGGHGLRRLEAYSAQVRAGKVAGQAWPGAERLRSGLLRVDAGHGFAFPAFDLALAELADMVAGTGVAAAAIHRSHHAGVLGLTVERFAEAGLVALMMANAPGAMAPWGGRRPLFGTNPIAFAAPLPEGAPLVIDLSLSRIARGKVMAAKQKGASIPEGWALDAEGRPTTDPVAALAGTMLPAGDAKGAALALVVELMSAGLTGANYAADASSLFDDKGPPPGLGQWILVIDPAPLGGPAVVARIGALVAAIAAEPGARVPGQGRLAARARAEAEGLALDADLLAVLRAL
jgi:(2R)-3-sulfolactate dehydrogenase (NADP+)